MAIAILRLPTVKARTGLSRSSIYLRVSQGRFPSPIRLGDRAVGWLEEDVHGWIAERIRASREIPDAKTTGSETVGPQ